MFNTHKSDCDLLKACVQGNAQAFAMLVDKYQSLVCAITYSGTGRFDTSEELAQETFLLAWRNLGQLNDFNKFQAWLCRIARSTVQNWLRKLKRDVVGQAVSLKGVAEQVDAEYEPAQVMIQREQEALLNQALRHIPDKYRESLILFYREEKSTREVAERLGLSESNARQRIARARNMLRDQMAAMVETTLTQSRPGKAFTGMVMASVAGSAFKGTVATAVVGQANGYVGFGLSAACTGIVAKIAIVAAGVAVIAGGMLLHRQLTNRMPSLPGASRQIETEVNQSVSSNSQVAGMTQTRSDTENLGGGNTLYATNAQGQSLDLDPPVQPQTTAEHPTQFQAPPVLSGTLTDIETGRPIVGARIQIAPSEGGRVYYDTTDMNGVYTFQSVSTNGTYSIRPKPHEYITQADWEGPRETSELHNDKPFTRDFVLEKGCKIIIKAVNEAGQPVERVNFHAVYVSDEMGRGPKDTVRTDANGVTSVGGLRLDEYLIVGAHRDYALVGQTVKFEESKEIKSITFTMENGIEVAGIAACLDDLPASGWGIRAKPIWWHSSHSWPDDDPVAQDGTFRLKHILPGPHRLAVYIPEDGGSRGIWSAEVNLPPEAGFLDLHIPHPSPHVRVNLSGEVVFLGGDYDRGFWVHGQSTTGHDGSVYLRAGERQFTITDLVPGLYNLHVTIDGKRDEFKNIKVPRDGLLLEVSVAPKTTLHARVIDKITGHPVTSFKVRRGQDTWQQVTDPNGLLSVSSRGYEPRQVVIQAEGYGEILSKPIIPDTVEPMLIEMGIQNILTGRIVSEAGGPIEGATINYRYKRSRDEDPNAKYMTETDDQGRFRVQVDPLSGSMDWFVFRHPDYARVMKQIPLSEDRVSDVHIVMPEGGTVQGYAYDWHGDVLENAPIYFMDERHCFAYWQENRARLGKVVTDNKGFYRIDHLPAEMCYAFFGDPADELGVAISGVLPCNKQTLRFDIGGPWCASGRLLHQGKPFAHTRLTVSYDRGYAQGFQANTMTNDQGEFSFYGLRSGTRSLYCAIQDDRGRDIWIELDAYSFIEGEDQLLGDIELALMDVRIDLAFEDSTMPPESWEVFITEYDAARYQRRRVGQLRPRTDLSDPFVFENIPPGQYEVIASGKDCPSVRQTFSVDSGQTSPLLALTVPAGSAALSGQLVSSDVMANPSRLTLENQSQSLTCDMAVDARGYFHVENLPADDYIIDHAGYAGKRSPVLFEVSLQPGQHKTVQIPIDPLKSGYGHKGYLMVNVVTEQGIPIMPSELWLEQHGQILEPRHKSDDVTSFWGVPGTYTLCVTCPGFKPARTSIEMKSIYARDTRSAYTPVTLVMTR